MLISTNLDDYDLLESTILRHGEIDGRRLLKCKKYRWYDKIVLVGQLCIEWWEGEWVSCHDLLVTDKYRHYGLGNQLVEFIKSKGVNHLSVEPNNKIAIEMYQKHGFKLTGEKDGEYLRMELKEN